MPEATTPETVIPNAQNVLLLHGPKQQYQIERDYPIPKTSGKDEVLIKNSVIGLNPIDWKAP